MIDGLTEKQRAMRQTGIGASEVAAVVGIVPGAFAVWDSKVHGSETSSGSDFREFGLRFEDQIAKAWLRRNGQGMRLFRPGTIRHPRHRFALASPDRVVAPRGAGAPARQDWDRLLECKMSFRSRASYGPSGSGEFPERYQLQVAWQLAVTEMEKATLVACVNGEYREYPVTRDLEMEGLLIDQVGRWWRDYVVADHPPPPDSSEACKAYWARRYPQDTCPPVEPTPDLVRLVERLRLAREAIRDAEEDEESAANALRAALGDSSGVHGLMTYRKNRDSKMIDWESVARDANASADLIERHTTVKTGARVLRLLTMETNK